MEEEKTAMKSAEIDNFDLIAQHLTFEPVIEEKRNKKGQIQRSSYDVDQYEIHIMRRVKDCKATGNELGANESQRMIKSYEVKNLDYLSRKSNAIKKLCKDNNARAYFLLQVRDTRDYLINVAMKSLEYLMKKNYGVKAEHMVRSAFCSMHSSRNPIWMLDIDYDEMYGWTKEQIVELIKDNLKGCDKDPNEVWEVPTRNGFHLITPPFDTARAHHDCVMIFKDNSKGYRHQEVAEWLQKNLPTDAANDATSKLEFLKADPFKINEAEDVVFNAHLSLLGIDDGSSKKKSNEFLQKFRSCCKRDIAGWLHKDATTLLYAP